MAFYEEFSTKLETSALKEDLNKDYVNFIKTFYKIVCKYYKKRNADVSAFINEINGKSFDIEFQPEIYLDNEKQLFANINLMKDYSDDLLKVDYKIVNDRDISIEESFAKIMYLNEKPDEDVIIKNLEKLEFLLEMSINH